MNRIILFGAVALCLATAFADDDITLSGAYSADQEITCTTDTKIILNNVSFLDARLKLQSADETVPVTFTIYLPEGSFNTFNRVDVKDYCIKATKICNLVFDGPGALEVYSSKSAKGDGLVTCTDLTVRDGDIRVEFDNDKSDTPCIFLKGSYLQTAGKVKVKSAKKNCTNELCGVYFDTRESTFTLTDGKFNAEMAGTKSRAIDMKKSGLVRFDGGECKMEFEGPECRFISGGTNIVFNGGKFNFTTNVTQKMTAAYMPVNCAAVKSDWEININGGKFTVDLPLVGSEVFTMESGSHISVTGGELDLRSGDDCFHATKDIFVSGGTIKGESVYDDVLDANGGTGHGITISGGYVRAMASDTDTHGLDVNKDGVLTISGGIVIATDGVDTKMIGDASNEVGSTDFRQATYYATLDTDDYSGESIYLEGESNGVAIVKSPHLPVFAPGKKFNLLLSVPGRADDIEPVLVNAEVVFLLNDGTPSPRDVVDTFDAVSGKAIRVLPPDPETENEELLGFVGWSTNKDDRVARIGTDWIVGNAPIQYVYAVWRHPDVPVAPPAAVTGLVYDGTVKTGVPTGTGYAVTGNVATNAGSYTATLTVAEGYVWSDGSTSPKSVKWSIAKGTYDLSGITFPSASFKEDGSVHSIAVAGTLPAGVTVAYSGKRESALPGVFPVTASFVVADTDDWNAITTTLTATLTVISRVVDFVPIPVPPAVDELVYDGSAKTGVVAGVEFALTDNVATNAGSYTAVVTPVDGYKWEDGTTNAVDVSWSIAKGTYDLSGISFPDVSVREDGEVHSVAIVGTLPAGVTVSYSGTTSSSEICTNVVVASFVVADPANWNLITNTLTAKLIIVSKTAGFLPISVPSPVSGLVYDGSAKTGVPEGTGYTLVGNVATNAGEHAATATPVAGYTWTDGSTGPATIPWSIAKGTYNLSGVTFPSASFKEDGATHSIAVSGTLPDGVTVSYSGTRESAAAGVYRVTASFTVADPANWNAISKTLEATLTIVSKTAGLIAVDVPVAAEGLVYDGTAKTGVVGATGYGLVDNVATNAGAYVATATLAEGYKWSDDTLEPQAVEWSIAKGTYDVSGIAFPSASFVEDGQTHSIAVTGELPEGVSVSYRGATSRSTVGTNTVVASFIVADTDNWNEIETTLTATLAVTSRSSEPVRIDVPVAEEGLVYDGGLKAGVAEGEGYTVSGNTGTAAGSYTAVATPLNGWAWSDGSTDPALIPWSIAKGTHDLSGARFPSASFIADGRPHSISVIGRIPEGVEVRYDGETTRTEIGTNTVVASFEVLDPANWNAISRTLTATLAIISGKSDPGHEDDPDDPDAVWLSGYYSEDVTIAATNDLTVVLDDVMFVDCQLRLTGGHTVKLSLPSGSINTFSQTATNRPCIFASGETDIVIDGNGVLEVYATKKLADGEGLIACDDFTMTRGDVDVEFDNDKSKTPCINVRGDFRLTGGRLKVKSAKKNCDNDLVGVRLETPGTTFTVDGGEFHAEIAGTGGRAVDLADGCDAYFNAGECKMEFEGPNGRFVCGGEDIVFTGGEYEFTTNITAKMTNEVFHPVDLRAVKAGRSITVFGGNFIVDLPLAGSRAFSTDAKSDAFINIAGGRMSVLADGECFKTDGAILISGGEITAASLADDVFTAGPELTVSGGKICAFALGKGRNGLVMDDLGVLTIRGGCVVSTDGPGAEIIGADIFRTGFTDFQQPTFYKSVASGTYSGKRICLEGRSGGSPIVWTPELPVFTGSRVNLLVSMPGREPSAPEAADEWPLTTVDFLLNDGTDSPADLFASFEYVAGHVIGRLPTPSGVFASFKGWAADPEGKRPVGSGWVVPNADRVALYAVWTPHVGPTPGSPRSLFDGEIGEFTGAADTYTGWVRDPVTSACAALLEVKVTAAKGGKPCSVKVTVTPVGGKKKSYKTTVAPGEAPVDGFGIVYGSRGLAGTVTGIPGVADGSVVEAAVDVTKTKNAEEKKRSGEIPQGGWSFALANRDGGYDCISITVAKKGKASVKGTLADGAKFSQSVQGSLGDEWFAVPVVGSKKQRFSFVAWIRLEDGAVFAEDLDVARWWDCVAGPVRSAGLADGLHSIVLGPIPWDGYLTLVDGYSVTPDGETVTVAKGKPSVAKSSGKVMLDKATRQPTVSPAKGKVPANLAKLKLTYTKKTGIVKGSYKAYRIVSGKLKSETVNVSGAVIGDEFYGNAVFKKLGVVAIGWWD